MLIDTSLKLKIGNYEIDCYKIELTLAYNNVQGDATSVFIQFKPKKRVNKKKVVQNDILVQVLHDGKLKHHLWCSFKDYLILGNGWYTLS